MIERKVIGIADAHEPPPRFGNCAAPSP